MAQCTLDVRLSITRTHHSISFVLLSILEDEQPWLHNSCLGPVVDVQLVSDVYRTDRLVYRRVRDGLALSEIIGHKAFYIGRDLFYPTVYDSVTVTNCMTRFYTFIAHIPYPGVILTCSYTSNT